MSFQLFLQLPNQVTEPGEQTITPLTSSYPSFPTLSSLVKSPESSPISVKPKSSPISIPDQLLPSCCMN